VYLFNGIWHTQRRASFTNPNPNPNPNTLSEGLHSRSGLGADAALTVIDRVVVEMIVMAVAGY